MTRGSPKVRRMKKPTANERIIEELRGIRRDYTELTQASHAILEHQLGQCRDLLSHIAANLLIRKPVTREAVSRAIQEGRIPPAAQQAALRLTTAQFEDLLETTTPGTFPVKRLPRRTQAKKGPAKAGRRR